MSKQCKKCGKELADDALFCNECGTNQNEGAVPKMPTSSKTGIIPLKGTNTMQGPISNQLPTLKSNPKPKQGLPMQYIAAAVAVIILGGGYYFFSNMKSGPDNNGTMVQAKTEANQAQNSGKNNANTSDKEAAELEKLRNQQANSSKSGINRYAPILDGFEKRLSDLATRINNGGEDKLKLTAVGNVLVNDINEERDKLQYDRGTPGVFLENMGYLYGLQVSRAKCMIAGVNGNTSAFAEGGSYYEDFQKAYSSLKKGQ